MSILHFFSCSFGIEKKSKLANEREVVDKFDELSGIAKSTCN
jgi:hypothetical protein